MSNRYSMPNHNFLLVCRQSIYHTISVLLILCLVPCGGCWRRSDTSSPPAIEDAEFYSRYNQAVAAMGQFRYADAYRQFEDLRNFRSDDLDLAINTAIARLNMAGEGDIDAAQQIFLTVLDAQPLHPRANYCVGLLKTYQGPPSDPLPHFRIAAEANPDDPDCLYLLAKGLEAAGQHEDARSHYQRCLELNARYISAMLGLGRLSSIGGDFDDARQWISRFEKGKSDPRSRVFEFAYRRMGRLAEISYPQSMPTDDRPAVSVESAELFAAPEPFNCDVGLPDPMIQQLSDPRNSIAIVAVDLTGDGKLDLIMHLVGENALGIKGDGGKPVVWVNDGDDRYIRRTDFPWCEADRVSAILCGDMNQDGSVDLYFCRDGENQLWVRTSTNEWQLEQDEALTGGGFKTVSGLICDADHDGDLDIYCCNLDGPDHFLVQLSEGKYRRLGAEDGWSQADMSSKQVVAGDFDNHRDLDLGLLGADGDINVFMNQRGWKYDRDSGLKQSPDEQNVESIVAVDADRDGDVNLVTRNQDQILIWRRQGNQGWGKGSEYRLPINTDYTARPVARKPLAVVDLWGDNQREFLVAVNNGFTWLAQSGASGEVHCGETTEIVGWNLVALDGASGWTILYVDQRGELMQVPPGDGRSAFISVDFSGKTNDADSMRSNRSGIGTRYRIQSGKSWATGMSLPWSSHSGQSRQPELVGTNGMSTIDLIAVDWSDGVFQVEMGLPARQHKTISETQRQLASCPIVFAWDGEKYGFITDVLGVGGIGFMAEPGHYSTPRPWENLLLTDQQVQPNEGVIAIKLNEPFEEACYLKDVRMSVVDVPAQWKAVVDERMGINDPQPTGEVYFYRDEFPVIDAHCHDGKDQTAAVANLDRIAADVGDLDSRLVGLLENQQSLAFRFGVNATGLKRPALKLAGWVEYGYSQTVFSAWQAGRTFEAPTLEVSSDGESWHTIWKQFGYPAGMAREILVPLSLDNLDLKDDIKWFRIRSNMQVYWDQIMLVDLETEDDIRPQRLDLMSADLRRVGFPQRTTAANFFGQYDYSTRYGTWDVRHLPGFYTRFGPVTDLLRSSEDLVIFGPGEEVHIEFKLPGDLATGFRRYYLLELEGWCKDMDLYTDQGNRLGPYPGPYQWPPDELPHGSPRNTNITDDQKIDRMRRYHYRYESGPWYPTAIDDPFNQMFQRE